MRDSQFLSEAELEQIERVGDAEAIPHLVSAIRQSQHDVDGLRLSLDVARRDREELRSALLSAHAEIARLRGEPALDPRGGEGVE
jgi:hypothetical protein